MSRVRPSWLWLLNIVTVGVAVGVSSIVSDAIARQEGTTSFATMSWRAHGLGILAAIGVIAFGNISMRIYRRVLIYQHIRSKRQERSEA